jgi:hypothetical protein
LSRPQGIRVEDIEVGAEDAGALLAFHAVELGPFTIEPLDDSEIGPYWPCEGGPVSKRFYPVGLGEPIAMGRDNSIARSTSNNARDATNDRVSLVAWSRHVTQHPIRVTFSQEVESLSTTEADKEPG